MRETLDDWVTAFADWLRESGKAESTIKAYTQPVRELIT
jgi:hypothetical protein